MPADAISYRIRTLRKEAAASGMANSNDNPPAKSSQVKRTANSVGKQNSNSRKCQVPTSDGSE